MCENAVNGGLVTGPSRAEHRELKGGSFGLNSIPTEAPGLISEGVVDPKTLRNGTDL